MSLVLQSRHIGDRAGGDETVVEWPISCSLPSDNDNRAIPARNLRRQSRSTARCRETTPSEIVGARPRSMSGAKCSADPPVVICLTVSRSPSWQDVADPRPRFATGIVATARAVSIANRAVSAGPVDREVVCSQTARACAHARTVRPRERPAWPVRSSDCACQSEMWRTE